MNEAMGLRGRGSPATNVSALTAGRVEKSCSLSPGVRFQEAAFVAQSPHRRGDCRG